MIIGLILCLIVLTNAYDSPIIITKGGTYSGSWEGLESEVATILIKTKETVIIRDSYLRCTGDCIASGTDGVDVQIYNTSALGLTPSMDDTRRGKFMGIQNARNIVSEHNYFEQTSGQYFAGFQGDGSENQTIRVRYNQAKNIDGRYRNGGQTYVQFCQFNTIRNLANVEIAWNQVINEPGNSRVEDNINLFQSSGTSSSKINIHNNFIYGAYPTNPTDSGFTGGGIIIGDSSASTDDKIPAFVKAVSNQVVSTVHYGLAFVLGHDLEIRNNRVVCTSHLPNGGAYLQSANVGIYSVNGDRDCCDGNNSVDTSTWYNNYVTDNVIGYVNKGEIYTSKTNPLWLVGIKDANSMGNTLLPYDDITEALQENEFNIWQQKLLNNNIIVGLQLQQSTSSGNTEVTVTTASVPSASITTDAVTTAPVTTAYVSSASTTTGTVYVILLVMLLTTIINY